MTIVPFLADPKTRVNTLKDQMLEKPIDIDALLGECTDLIEYADDACWDMLDQTYLTKVVKNSNLCLDAMDSKHLILVVKGCVRVYTKSHNGREVTLYRVNEGQLCAPNLNNRVSELVYPIIVQTETDILGLVITRPVFYKALAESNSFRNYVLSTLTQRLPHMGDLISSFAFERLDLRIAGWLNQKFENNCGEPIKITHSELAQELGAAREIVRRILKDFEHMRCIQLARGRIKLQCRYALNLVSEGRRALVELL